MQALYHNSRFYHKLTLKTNYTKEFRYTRKVNTREGMMFIPPWQDQPITMNTNEILGDNDDTRFFTEVHLFTGKLVPVVVIHSLGGSRANRHHTPNPQSGAAHKP
jgi:hypothetical protein